jgi:integrase/recombinase XerD
VESDDLFLGHCNNGVQSKTIQRALQRFSKTAGIQNVTPHTLLHSFAKALIDVGLSLKKVSTRLGHSNLNTTRIYITSGEDDLEDTLRNIDI